MALQKLGYMFFLVKSGNLPRQVLLLSRCPEAYAALYLSVLSLLFV
jgi:hypothetical protein